ncbi:UNVERIFIED_CONTAM: hypothetical protein PYX00_000553 [Menopon gallinae]|uniref:ABC-type xenobiotic transporter n=1 Tax=Menopon gallinae TaxID=328185 RepID=A0AAW2I9I8_9NEOP
MGYLSKIFEVMHSKREPSFGADDNSYVRAKATDFRLLYRSNTRPERFLLCIGVVAAVIASTGVPLITKLHGEFINILIERQFPTSGQIPDAPILQFFGCIDLRNNATLSERMNALKKDAVLFALSVSLFAVLSLIFLGIAVTIFNFIAVLQVNRMKVKLLGAFLSMSPAWFEVNGPMHFASDEHLARIQQGVGENMPIFIYQMTMALTMLSISLYEGWLLTLVLMGCLMPMLLVFVAMNKAQKRLTVLQAQDVETASHLARESLSAIRTVVAFSGENKEIERYSGKLYDAQTMGTAKAIVTGIGIGVSCLVVYCTYAVAFSFGFRLILWLPKYTPGVLVTVFFAALIAATSLSYLGPCCDSYAAACNSTAVIYQIIDNKPTSNPFSDDGVNISNFSGDIEFRDVHFFYPSMPESEVLKGLTFKIKAGERVALVGASGSGKSTVLHLIQRLYDPVVGDVFVDGKNVKVLNISWFRKQLAVVPQENVLFTGTINDNISFGMPHANAPDIVAAARRAYAHEFIIELPNGYETHISYPGTNLSGGQKQRIAIARALLRTSKVLLFDEISAELDRDTENLVYKSLDDHSVDRTVILVTRNLSILRRVDRILVLKDGVLAEEGSHQTLMSVDGIYNNWTKIVSKTYGKLNRHSGKVQSGTTMVDIVPIPIEENIRMFPVARGSYFSEYGAHGKHQRSPNKGRFLKVTFCQFLIWNKSHFSFLFFGMLASVLSGLIWPAACLFIANLIESLKDDVPSNIAYIDINSISIAFLGVIAGFLAFMQVCFLGIASLRLSTYLKLRAFETMLRQEIAWFDYEHNDVDSLCSYLNLDSVRAVSLISNRTGVIIQGFTTVICGIFLCAYFCWKLSLATVLLLPFIFLALFLDSFSLNKQVYKELQMLEKSNKIAMEALGNIRVVKSLGIESHFLEKYEGGQNHPHQNMQRFLLSAMRGFAFSAGQTAVLFGYAFTFWFGSWLIESDGIHFKYVILVVELIVYGAWILCQSICLGPDLCEARQAAGRLQYILHKRARIYDGPSAVHPFTDRNDDIEFTNVYFAYPARSDFMVLKNFNMTIRTGESIAIVGPSGSGKSSVIQLLLRFYDPSTGAITIGNNLMKSLNLTNLRYSMGLVAQEPVLFRRTIFENIAYGDNRRQITLDEVIDAAKAANIHSFIMSLPSGYDTKIGSAYQLSVGQKQKIAIARALIRNPKVLLLDEATSSLDPESVKAIQETLTKAMYGRTTITIAHGPGSVLSADSTYVLVRGRIVEAGTHNDLIRLKGFYYRMHADF